MAYKTSEDRVMISIPRKDVELLMRLAEDIKFIEKSEKGFEEIEKGDFISLDDYKKKRNIQ